MWARILSALCGCWLLIAPALLGYGGAAEASDRITGPLVIAISIIALWEVTRGVRWAALPIALWLIAAPWLLGFPSGAAVSEALVGAAVAALAFAAGQAKHRYGGGWRALWESDPPA